MARERKRSRQRRSGEPNSPEAQSYAEAEQAFGGDDENAVNGAIQDELSLSPPQPVAAAPGEDAGEVFDDEISGRGERSGETAVATRPQGNRVIGFLRASWAELQRVQWPDRRAVFQATAVVLGFVVVAGAFLGLADYVSQKIVNAIL
jgi:preprotein translocase SecE subunit